MPNQNDLIEPPLTGEVDPRSDVSYGFTRNTPVATAAQPLPLPVAGNRTDVVHASIYGDTRVPEIREGPANSDVCRGIEIHSPPVDPDHGDGFGGLFRRDKESTPVGNIIARSCIDQFFGVLTYRVSSGEPLSETEPKHQQSKGDCGDDEMPPGKGWSQTHRI